MSRVQTLGEMTTVEAVLDTVAEFGREAHGYYVELIPQVSKHIRYLVEDLARAELDHVRRIGALSKSPELADHLRDAIRRPQADRRFSDAVHLPDLDANPDDQAVLQYALHRVQVALEEYSELAADELFGPLHEVFVFLANEEARHKADLEALYYEVVHSGGV